MYYLDTLCTYVYLLLKVIIMNCKFVKSGGENCRALAIKGGDYCFFHEKSLKDQRLESAAKGGMTPKRVFKSLPAVALTDSKSVVELLATTINEVRNGDLDIRIANCIGFLSGHLLKAMEQSDIVMRLQIMERTISEKKSLKK